MYVYIAKIKKICLTKKNYKLSEFPDLSHKKGQVVCPYPHFPNPQLCELLSPNFI